MDGKFGSKTQSAVKDYQKKKGLDVDGIVGDKTWGSLYSVGGSVASNKSSSQKNGNTAVYTAPKPSYKKSDAVISAENAVADWENKKPEQYKSKYSDEIERILNDILGREEFNYNMSSDPLYEQYKEQYMLNGKKAMLDTVGNSLALTGGYNNSYAQSVGNQVYDDYLLQLNDIALDLRDRAYDEYKDEGDKLVSDVSLLRSLDGDDYEKYLGELQRYYDDGNYLLEKLSSMTDSEFEAFKAELDSWQSDRDYAFSQYQDALDREEFEKELAFKKAEAQRDQANADREYALAKQKAYSSGSSKSLGSSDDSADKKNGVISLYPSTYKEFVSRTGVSTILTQAQFESSSKYKALYEGEYKAYLKAMYNKYK